jgi:hypothetical protein
MKFRRRCLWIILLCLVNIPVSGQTPPPKPPPEEQIPPKSEASQDDQNLSFQTALTEMAPSEPDSSAVLRTSGFPVWPIRLVLPPNALITQSDSTLRWDQRLEWTDHMARTPGVISSRLGGFGRPDALHIFGYEPTAQRLFLEGMSQRNPVTGRVNFAHLSLERLESVREYEGGLSLRTDVELNRYYTRKPLTRVRYEQGPFDLRSTESMISQMISPRLGAEISYHAKNFDGEYRRSATESHQIGVRTFYHINETYVAQAMLLYNGSRLQESDGYQIPDLASFNFSRFFAPPLQSNARSSVRQTQMQFSLLRRKSPAQDSNSASLEMGPADARVMIYYDRYHRFYRSPSDTSAYRFESLHMNAMKYWTLSWVQAQGEIRSGYYFSTAGKRESLDITEWLASEMEGQARFFPEARIQIPLHSRFVRRSDGFNEGEIMGGVELRATPAWILYGQAAVGQQAPTMQQRYWRGAFQGNRDLEEARISRISGGIRFSPGRGALQAELRGYVQTSDLFTILGVDSVFAQIRDMGQWGGVAGASYASPNWEISFSATLQQYTSDNMAIPAQLLSGSGLRLWNRGSLHWKGYLFDRATYVKMGVYGMFSPNAYRTARYFPVGDVWDNSFFEPQIPGFARVDADLSARVRSLFFLLRYENITQGLGQWGYYETAGYPMPSRRLRFGLRVYFTN